jgi:ferredoxin
VKDILDQIIEAEVSETPRPETGGAEGVLDYPITLLPTGNVIKAKPGESILQAAKRQGVIIKSSCGGVASCRSCLVRVIEGEKHMNPIGFDESQLIGNVFHITRERLSCQLNCQGPMTIDITEHRDATPADMGSKTLK